MSSLTIRKVNGTTVAVSRVVSPESTLTLKLTPKNAPAVYGGLSKGAAREIRKALHGAGHVKLAAIRRAA